MKVVIRNIVRDRAGKELRRRHANAVVTRPMVLGRPLQPKSTRVVRVENLNEKELSLLKHYQDIGCIQVLIMGASRTGLRGGALQVEDLAAKLGISLGESTKAPEKAPAPKPAPKPAPEPEPEPEPEPAPEPEPEMVRARDEDGQFIGDDPATPENEAWVEAPVTDETPEEETEDTPSPVEESAESAYTEKELMAMLKSELRSLLSSLGGDAGTMTKRQITDEILSLQES